MAKMRKGFTLIELLIVIVIIGIVATIALPKLVKMRDKAHFRSLVSDLRNLSTQQELYFTLPANSYSYATDEADLPDFYESTGVVVTMGEATASGWVATATHLSFAPDQACGVFVGAVTPKPDWLTSAGVITCDK